MSNDKYITKFNNELLDLINKNSLTQIKETVECSSFSLTDLNSYDTNPIIFCIEHHVDTSITKYFINCLENINFETDNGKIPLFTALENENFPLANFLLEKRADINYLNKKQENILFYLLKNRRITKNSLKYILDHKMNINYRLESEEKSWLFLIIKQENEELLNTILDYFKYNNELIIHLIFMSKRKLKINNEHLQNLIYNQFHTININIKFTNGTTPLIYACKRNNVGIAKLFIECGANVNDKSSDSETALWLAIENKNETLVQLLVEHGAKINEKIKNDKTALDYAILNGHNGKLVKLILETKKSVYGHFEKSVNTLIFAVMLNWKIMLDLLIGYGYDINGKDENGDTPLSYAYYCGNEYMIEILLGRGANVNEDFNGETLLMSAVQSHSMTIVKLFIDHGANVNARNKDGDTVLMLAIKSNYPKMVEFLVNHGANINDKNKNKDTILMLAIKANFPKVVEFLIHHGAKVNEDKNNEGKTALMLAIKQENKAVIKLLIKSGAQITTKTTEDETILMLAAKQKNKTIYKLLLKEGSRVSTRSIPGSSTTLDSLHKKKRQHDTKLGCLCM